jgi:hypothetical protein
MDPGPLVEVSVNGGPPKRFTFYTGAPWLGMSAEIAKEAGLRAVASQKIDYLDGTAWQYFGVLDSFKLGGIELRNIPVEWSETDTDAPGPPGDGLIGTWVFYHFLTTFDYAGRSLILRRRTPEVAGKARADATRAGAKPLPLWLAREHGVHSTGSVAGSGTRLVGLSIGGTSENAVVIPVETAKQLRIRTDYDRAGTKPLPLWLAREHAVLSRGSFAGIAGSGTRVVGVNFGGVGEIAAGMRGDTAKQLGIRSDYDREIGTFGSSHPAVVYPCYPKEIRLGNAAAKDIYCSAVNRPPESASGFDTLGAFFHPFYKPYNITLDFTDMNVYIARGKAG